MAVARSVAQHRVRVNTKFEIQRQCHLGTVIGHQKIDALNLLYRHHFLVVHRLQIGFRQVQSRNAQHAAANHQQGDKQNPQRNAVFDGEVFFPMRLGFVGDAGGLGDGALVGGLRAGHVLAGRARAHRHIASDVTIFLDGHHTGIDPVVIAVFAAVFNNAAPRQTALQGLPQPLKHPRRHIWVANQVVVFADQFFFSKAAYLDKIFAGKGNDALGVGLGDQTFVAGKELFFAGHWEIDFHDNALSFSVAEMLADRGAWACSAGAAQSAQTCRMVTAAVWHCDSGTKPTISYPGSEVSRRVGVDKIMPVLP